jgi:hypothetical protein
MHVKEVIRGMGGTRTLKNYPPEREPGRDSAKSHVMQDKCFFYKNVSCKINMHGKLRKIVLRVYSHAMIC